MFGHKKVKPAKRTKPQPKRTPVPKKTVTPKSQKRVVARKTPTLKKKVVQQRKTKPAVAVKPKPYIPHYEHKKLNKTKEPPIRAGEYANINAESAHGHLGVVTKRYKNGKMDAITATHSEKYPKRKKIKLEENPNPKERDRTSYLNKRGHKNVTDNDIGIRRPDVRIKNAVDKSKLRKLKTITKRKKIKKLGGTERIGQIS